MHAFQLFTDAATDFSGRIRRILPHQLKVIRQQSEPLIDIVVKLSCDPCTLLFVRFNQPAANFRKGFFRQFALGDICHHPYHPHHLALLVKEGVPGSLQPKY